MSPVNIALKSLFSRLRTEKLPSLPPGLVKGIGPLVMLAAGVTALVLMLLWRDQAGYKPVFGAREKISVSDVVAVLDAEHVPYRLHPDSGQVLVPDASLGKVRMLLASKGVVAKLPAGLELMDRNDPLGVSQFVQDVRFRRGLEGDLVQSILTIDAIDSARVHLSIAKSSSFVVSDGEKSSASVAVVLKAGRTLTAEQIAAIINLVSGSVASLDPQRVSLVDQAGNLLSARVDLTEGFDPSSQVGEAAHRYQDETRRNVRELLGTTLGEQNYQVSVTAEVDNDRIQETREIFGGDPKVTNEAVRQEVDRRQPPVGVPGSLSNRPINATANDTPGATNSTDPAVRAAAEGNAEQKSATSRQYSYDRNITQIKRSRGRLRRLNVAVVLNSAAAPSPRTGWTPAQISDIERVLSSGLGIDSERGDKLTVTAMPFPAKPVPQKWWEQRENIIDMVSWAIYALGALLAYLLIARPLLRLAQQHMAAPAWQPAGAGAALPLEDTARTNEAAALAAPHLENETPVVAATQFTALPLADQLELPEPGSPVDVMVDHLKALAVKEPERVAEVLKQWVQRHGSTEQLN